MLKKIKNKRYKVISHSVIIIDPRTGEETSYSPPHDGDGTGNRESHQHLQVIAKLKFNSELTKATVTFLNSNQSKKLTNNHYPETSSPEMLIRLKQLFEGEMPE